MKNLGVVLIALAVATGFTSTAVAGAAIVHEFGCRSSLCVINENYGGSPRIFGLAAKEALREHVKIRINGTCGSACVIFASQARRNVCLTENARMEIHRGEVVAIYDLSGKAISFSTPAGLAIRMDPPPGYRTEITRFTPDYGDDVNAWAFRENKMPYDGAYTMTRAEALRFWKPCH